MRKGINHFLAVLASQNFRTSVIMSDGEGAVISLVDELGKLGVEVDISGAGGHVAIVERRIRVIKERVRSHVAYHLPFTLSTVGITMCVLYVISRLNYEPSGLWESAISPREAFIGRKPDGKRDFRCSFGDYAQCTVPNTDNTLKSRTEDCVVMLPLGNRTGTVRMLSLGSGRLVNRDQFRILPMPESVIKRLNELALEDGRVKGKGELAIRATSFEQDGDSKKGMPDVLPDTIEAAVNNGIDPTLAALDSEDFPDIINDMPDEPEHSEGSTTDMMYDLSQPNYVDHAIAAVRLPMKPKSVEMEDLINSLRGMEVGPYVRTEDSEEAFDAQGVAVDYTAQSCSDAGVGETEGARDDTVGDTFETRMSAEPGPLARMRREDFMSYFRGE